jgi:hypothetical protein
VITRRGWRWKQIRLRGVTGNTFQRIAVRFH